MLKRLIPILIAIAILMSSIVSADGFREKEDNINLLIIHSKDSSNYLGVYQNYNQSLIPNLKLESISIDRVGNMDLSKYHIVYLDKSIKGKDDFKANKHMLMSYVRNGGYLFLENSFYDEFPKEFIGVSGFEKLENFPTYVKYPEVKENFKGIQELFKTFHDEINSFYDPNTLNSLNLGVGFVPSTAKPLAASGELTLLGINNVGSGCVFLSSGIIPNEDFITGFDMKAKDKSQSYFNYTFATGNYLFRNEFVSTVSKEIYGYSVEKVLGTYGRPAMAWQNHFEVLSAVKNGSMEKWIDVLKEYDEIPSYSLARSLFEWGSWKESIIAHTNVGTTGKPAFIGEEENSHYSTGKHLETEKDYVSIATYPQYKNLYAEIELPYRAYPDLGDLNGDGTLDIVSGSANGYAYVFLGKEDGEGLQYENREFLNGENEKPINVGSYSAPILYDLNRDGKLDLIVGNKNGQIISFINIGDMEFKKDKILLEEKNFQNVSPTIGDLDGDGVEDLVLGNSKGELYFYKGKKNKDGLVFDKKGMKFNVKLDSYSAPRIVDYDGDGKVEIVVGSKDGYIKVYKNRFPKLVDSGYIEGKTLNPFKNKNLWGGYYSVPAFGDINKDGRIDLLVGQIEFGLPKPIDSSIFPYKKQLENAIDYANKNYIEFYPHTYFHSYKSYTQERKELELHKEAFEYYGIPWENQGTNQHTWRINNISPTQSFHSEIQEGIKWNSGFRPSQKAGEPSLSRDYIWAMPFYLSNGEKVEDFILFNPAPNIPIHESAYKSISSLDLPITYFYHMEYAVQEEKGLKDLRYKASFLNNLRNKYDYNFMTENQMFEAFSSVMNGDVHISRVEKDGKISFTFTPSNPNENVLGIKFEPGEALEDKDFFVDGDIYIRKGKNLYIGLNRKVNLIEGKVEDSPHIERVNVPVDIQYEEEYMEIKLKKKGLQQVKIYAPKGIEVLNEDFEIKNEGNSYIFTRYGDETTLKLKLE